MAQRGVGMMNHNNRQIEVLYHISRALAGKCSLDEILGQVVRMTAELVDSKICALLLFDETKTNLLIRATQSLSPAYLGKGPIPVGYSVVGRVVEIREAIQVADVTADPRYRYPEIARNEGLKSLLSVPLFMQDRVIGALNCYTEAVREFSPEEIQLVQIVANQAAAVIEHGRVSVEEAEARQELETRKSVETAKRELMKRRGFNEQDAHRFIQKTSMSRGRPLKETAEALMMALTLEA
jgi:signal transduction protein with GAF and PtsI domain